MILLLSGTSEGKSIAAAFNQWNLPSIVTTVTEYGGALLLQETDKSRTQVQVGPLHPSSLETLLEEGKIRALVDATHPYANQITWMAYEKANACQIPFIRWHRPGLSEEEKNHCLSVEDYETAAKTMAEMGGKWLLTTGSNHLEVFCQYVNSKELIIRIMPFPKVLEKCLALGFSPGQIIAQQGPFSCEMNRLQLKELGVEGMVTKDSGAIGGVKEKIQAVREEKKKMILIQRPPEPPAPKAENLQQLQELLLPILSLSGTIEKNGQGWLKGESCGKND
ncbi:precorrin-6A reductase [Tindallia californiensis]|uniref:Precorrin-6A/cobalt-precorrin-6A reductase n=1 Tax=Tindallia californiensis TaxID=159292 RepID=A0A1H3PJ83_9FIRM|nr:precorrin-6A reductase [Tindallia californiensis]SDZ00895.1 precorrin-6A/cobalt-precorrin-6A reductase [Tindallia californiensis]